MVQSKSRRKYISRVPTGTPPVNETIQPIPVASGAFLEILEDLKDQAFEEVMVLGDDFCATAVERPKCSISYKINGFLAFRRFYAHEFYRLPMTVSAKYFAAAWEACPDKHIWESYALQYRSYLRKEHFLTWLLTCEKKNESAHSLVVFYEIESQFKSDDQID